MAESTIYRTFKTLIFGVLYLCLTTNKCYANPPEKGIFTIPQMKIVYSNTFELIDSIIDFELSNNAFAQEYDIFISMAKITCGENYEPYYNLAIWLDRTKGIPWSNRWYAYYNYRGHKIFMNELFANLFTDGEKVNYTAFDYSCASDRKTERPIYEWHYNIYLNIRFEELKKNPYPIDQGWLEYLEDKIIYSEDDIWLKE